MFSADAEDEFGSRWLFPWVPMKGNILKDVWQAVLVPRAATGAVTPSPWASCGRARGCLHSPLEKRKALGIHELQWVLMLAWAGEEALDTFPMFSLNGHQALWNFPASRGEKPHRMQAPHWALEISGIRKYRWWKLKIPQMKTWDVATALLQEKIWSLKYYKRKLEN